MIKKSGITKYKDRDSDKFLFLRMSKNEYRALNILFNRYYSALCQFGRYYEKDTSVIEEKISDVFIQLWNKRKTLDQIANPKPYLYVIARNQLSKRKTTKPSFEYLDENLNHIGIPHSPSKEEEVIVEEYNDGIRQYLNRILNVLPKKSKRIFLMSRVEGFKYNEIAEIMEISPRTVETHIAIAVRYLSRQKNTLNT